jgi:hypothetical protein
MVLDIRAQIICNLGPVISGSVKDDHVQGQGLVMTTGELVIAGLVPVSHGSKVTLGYVTPDGTKAARFPRGPFYVTKAFADPLANQTQVSIADKLAFEKNKGGGVVNSALVDALNGREPKVAKALDLREAFDVIAKRLDIDVEDAGNWKLPKQIPSLESTDYIETLSDILASVTRFGHLNARNKLVTYSYKKLPDKGPVVGFDQVVDLAGNQGGLNFTENPTGTGESAVVSADTGESSPIYKPGIMVIDAEYGSFTADWGTSETITETSIKLTLKNRLLSVQPLTRSFPVIETVKTFEKKAEPDNRVIERITETTTSLVKVNSQIIQDFLNAGVYGLFGPSASRQVSSKKTDRYTYEEIPPPPLSEQEQSQVEQEIDAARQQVASSHPGSSHPILSTGGTVVLLPTLPTYREIRHESVETMSYIEALGRMGIKDYTKIIIIPNGEKIKQRIVTDTLYADKKLKKIERTYVAYGLTQMGQQAISAAAANATTGWDLNPVLDQFFELVLEDVKVVTSDLDNKDDEKPVPDYLAPYQWAMAVIQGGSRIQVGATPETRPNTSFSFSVPFLPDDVVNDDGTVTKGSSTSAAADYAEEQNRLLLGHRLGLQVTTALGVLPTQPLGAFHLRNGGITATYRTNGTVWTFDANSCLVSTDALYWGLAGGDVSGPRWTPVAPGTSALPIPPADVDNGPQDPVNSATIVSPVDETDSAAVETLLDSLPDDETETFELELTPVALALPYKPITETALQVRLQLEQLLVPLGINRSLGDATGQVVLQVKAQQEIAKQVVLQVASGERQVLQETLSGGFSLGGNLS